MANIRSSSPNSNNVGEITKRNGTTYAVHPNRMETKPVVIGSAFVNVAAAKAARAMGGVIIDIMPK